MLSATLPANWSDGTSGSLWKLTAAPAPPSAELQEEMTSDVVVVGGGFCGLSCALHLAVRGADVVLLEAEEAGWGASGRNGGQLIPGFKDDPETLNGLYGEDLGERMSALGASGGQLVSDLISRYSIECAFRREGWILGIHSAAIQEAMTSRARQWKARGRNIQMLDQAATANLLGTDSYLAGYHDPEGGALNPLSFARGLARAFVEEGGRLFTGSRALRLRRDVNGRWLVSTCGGQVSATQVVLATGAYSDSLFDPLKRSVLPVQSIQIATAPLPAELRRSILPAGHVVSDSRRLLLYFRQQEDGRLIFGGRGSLGETEIRHSHVQRLENAMRATFPQLGKVVVEHVWAGLVDLTLDRRLHVHRPSPGVTAIVGFNGRGVSIAPAVGRAVAEAIVEDDFGAMPLPVTPVRPVRLHSVRRPAMALMTQYYRLLDRIGG